MIPFDSFEFFYPSVYFSATGFRAGDWPWWNPLVYSGYPQVADPQGLMFSPLLMPLMMLWPQPDVTWFDFCVVLHSLAGGIAVLLLCSAYRFPASSALLASIVYMVGGAASARLQHTVSVVAYSYLPWVILSGYYFPLRFERKWAVALGIATGAMLLHPGQPSFLFALFAAGYIAVRCFAARSGSAPWLRGLAIAATVSFLVAGVQIAVTLAMLPLSTRHPFDFQSVVANSLTPQAFATLLWPNAFGSLDGPYSGNSDPTESYLYVGIVTICVLVLGLSRALLDFRNRPEKLYLVCATLVCAAYMIGAHTPLFRLMYELLPGVSLFRRPSDAAFLFNFCIALLAGFSATILAEDSSGRESHAIRILLLASGWMLVIAGLEAWRGNGYRPILLLASVAASIAWFGARIPPNRRAATLAIGLAIVCLGDARLFNVPTQLNGHGMNPVASLRAPRPAIRAILDDPEMSGPGVPMRVEPTMAGEFASTTLMIHRIFSTQGYNPLRVQIYSEVFGSQESNNSKRPSTAALLSRHDSLFDISGARYVLTESRTDIEAMSSDRKRFQFVVADGALELWRNAAAYPRVLAPTAARVLPVAAQPAASDFNGVDFLREVLLHPLTRDDEDRAREAADQCNGQARIDHVSYGNSYIELDVVAREPSWIAISDVYFPGWRATAGGRPLRIWRANGLYRAVCAPAGEYRLDLRFDPIAFLVDAAREAVRRQ